MIFKTSVDEFDDPIIEILIS